MRYAEWIRKSNSAAVYREAFGLADQMGNDVRVEVIRTIHLLSERAFASSLSRKERTNFDSTAEHKFGD